MTARRTDRLEPGQLVEAPAPVYRPVVSTTPVGPHHVTVELGEAVILEPGPTTVTVPSSRLWISPGTNDP